MAKPDIYYPKIGRCVRARNSSLIEGNKYWITRLDAYAPKSNNDPPWAQFDIEGEISDRTSINLWWHDVRAVNASPCDAGAQEYEEIMGNDIQGR